MKSKVTPCRYALEETFGVEVVWIDAFGFEIFPEGFCEIYGATDEEVCCCGIIDVLSYV